MEFKSVIERPFINLFVDATAFAQFAEEIGPHQFQKAARFVRTSISSAVLSIECAANCCVAQLSNGGGFRNDIDKLPFLSKFEVYLGLNYPGRTLDRGRIEVQKAQELKSIRDRLVHPKQKTASIRIKDEKEGQMLCEGDFGIWELNRIKRLERAWNHEDAVKVLRATTDFLNMYFLELCGLNHNKTCKILMNDWVTEPQLKPFETQYNFKDPHLEKAATEWGIGFKFLGIVSTA
jgi:hypothetical protein